MAKVGTSAIESRKLGYLLDSDVIVPNKDELLHVAIAAGEGDGRRRLPRAAQAPVPGGGPQRQGDHPGPAGEPARRRLHQPHDFHIASLIANVVTGGDVDAGTLVSEEYLMTLERQAFCELVQHPKTQERILGMLSTGKPVRN
jgi:3-hydroxyacyl-CoA dehydrogenase